MKKLVLLVVVLACVGLANAEWLYNAPTGGTLVYDKSFGTNGDGAGDWIDGTGGSLLTVNSDSITIETRTDLPAGVGMGAPIAFSPYAQNYVLDIAIKGWNRNPAGTPASYSYIPVSMAIFSPYGDYYYVMFKDNGVQGTVDGNNGNPLDFDVDTGIILRVTGGPGTATELVAGGSTDTTTAYQYAGSQYNDLWIGSYGNQSYGSIEIEWMKVYTDVRDAGDPGVFVPEPASMGLLAIGGLVALIRRRRRK